MRWFKRSAAPCRDGRKTSMVFHFIAATVTINPDGAETIDEVATKVTTTQYENFTVVSDGTEWWLI